MNKYIIFPFFVLLLSILFYYALNKYKMFETFSDSNKYQQCRSSGFTKEFCLANPLPNQCICENGKIGKFKIGFKGICICDEKKNNENVTSYLPYNYFIF